MAIDILKVKPHQVSRDLCGYTMLFYGAPKTGKTTIASQFPDTLLLAFEIGFITVMFKHSLTVYCSIQQLLSMWFQFSLFVVLEYI